jgi:hypothetical protein
VTVESRTRSPKSGKAVAAIAVAWVAGVIGFVTLLGFGVASCMNSINFNFDLGGPAVKPIPIPATACPYLRVVHVAASAAGVDWFTALGYGAAKQWQPFARQLEPKLTVLESSLVASIPHVPHPVARDFEDTAHQIVIGHSPTASRNVNDYLNRTNSAVITGWSALNHASELIGNACGFDFAPTT